MDLEKKAIQNAKDHLPYFVDRVKDWLGTGKGDFFYSLIPSDALFDALLFERNTGKIYVEYEVGVGPSVFNDGNSGWFDETEKRSAFVASIYDLNPD